MDYRKMAAAHDKVLKILDAFKPYQERLSDFVQPEVVREEYGTGGECLHRGFYCPSIIDDIVVGNASRGRVQKTKPKKGRLARTFGFNANDALILVDNPDCTEYIFREAQCEIGVTVTKYPGLHGISEVTVCTYEQGRIASYVHALCNFYEDRPKKRITELNMEDYQYGTDVLIVNRYRNCAFHNNCCEYERYTFAVHDGYLTSYTVEDFDANGMVRPFWKDHLFSVDVKRKIG